VSSSSVLLSVGQGSLTRRVRLQKLTRYRNTPAPLQYARLTIVLVFLFPGSNLLQPGFQVSNSLAKSRTTICSHFILREIAAAGCRCFINRGPFTIPDSTAAV